MSWLIKFLTGGGLSAIGEQLNKAYSAKLNAKNNSERIEAEKLIAQLTSRQSVLIAEQGNWLTRWIRPAFAFPFVVYLNKVIIWDKVLGWGTTDPLSAPLAEIMMVLIGAYFLTRPLDKLRRR